MAKVLLVEDNLDLASELVEFLNFQKYDVIHLDDGLEASSHIKVYEYDVIILDWNFNSIAWVDVS